MSTMPVSAEGEVTFSLAEAHFSEGRCRQITAGGAQWRQARLHSPVGSLELAQVNGTFRCTADGAVALTLRQDSHQLSLSGQGTLSPDGRYLFRGTLQPRQGMPPLLALLVTRPASKTSRVAHRGRFRENGYPRSKMTTLTALSLHFPPCLVWLPAAVRPGAGQLLQRGDLSSAARMLTQTADDERITLSTPGSLLPAVPPADRLAGQYPAAQFPLAGPSRPLL